MIAQPLATKDVVVLVKVDAVMIVAKEIVKEIAWELVRQHAKAVAKTHAVGVVPILVLVVQNNKSQKKMYSKSLTNQYYAKQKEKRNTKPKGVFQTGGKKSFADFGCRGFRWNTPIF